MMRYHGFTLNEIGERLRRAETRHQSMLVDLGDMKRRLDQLSFEIGLDQGEAHRAIGDVKRALKDVLLNLNGDLIEVYKKHPVIKEVLSEP